MKFNQKLNTKKKSVFTMAVVGLAMSCLVFSNSSSAQSETPAPPATQQQKVKTDFSDSQLKTFVSVNQKLQPLQQATEQKMQASIKTAGLTVERFQAIAKIKESGSKEAVTPDESTSFDKVVKDLMAQREKVDSEMQDIIKKEGMDVQTFQGIAMAYQQSPEIQQKIQKMLGGPTEAQPDSTK